MEAIVLTYILSVIIIAIADPDALPTFLAQVAVMLVVSLLMVLGKVLL